LCAEKKGLEVILVTGDRDAFQLIGPSTRLKLPRTRGGKTEVEEYDYNKIVEVYGIKPEQFVDVKALREILPTIFPVFRVSAKRRPWLS